MSLSAEDVAYAKELFSALPDLTTRKMFGGLGIYAGGVIFALVHADGQLFVKAQAGPFAERLAQMGSEQWTYTRKDGKPSAMPYWSLPDAAVDDPDLASRLAQDALAALDQARPA